jgi:transposase-like protein
VQQYRAPSHETTLARPLVLTKKSRKQRKVETAAQLGNESAEQRAARLERENQSLREENDSLRMDREILKKAAAFFAKESE